MSKAPEEPKMNDAKAEPRFCSAKITHEDKRLIGSSEFAMTAHCKSSTCSWCLPCFVAKTQRQPAA